MVTGREDDISRWLESLGREPPPDVTVDSIVERWRRQRRRSLSMLGGGGLVAALLALVFLRPPREQPPVHLDLRIVDVTVEESLDGALASFESAPAELSRP